MRIISIGDIHGHQTWKKVNPDDWDLIIFVGDYVDSFNVSDEDMVNNLADIIEFKKSYPDKVILLLGNHDIQYMFKDFGCSGFRPQLLPTLNIMFNENRSLFQVAYQYDRYLWSHAGVSKAWYKKYEEHLSLLDKDETLADRINEISYTSLNWILHEVGSIRGGLRYNEGGVTWADRSETMNNSLEDYHQIVGHTPIKEITTYNSNAFTSITYIDCLGKSGQFYELEV